MASRKSLRLYCLSFNHSNSAEIRLLFFWGGVLPWSFLALPDLVDGCVRCTWYQLPHQQMLLYLFSWHAGMLVNSSSRTSKHFNMVRNILISIIIFISTLKIELISWQVDLVRVDLVASWSCESWSGGNWSRENWSRDTESQKIRLHEGRYGEWLTLHQVLAGSCMLRLFILAWNHYYTINAVSSSGLRADLKEYSS